MNNKPPYLVSICSYPIEAREGLSRYLHSLAENVTPGSYELILIGYEPLINSPSVNGNKVRMYNFNTPYPGNLRRFDSLYELACNEMDPDRFIIFTDTYDVVFQKDFPNFEVFNRNEVLVANEGETWKESTWFPVLQEKITKVNFIQDMADKPILNAGTWAMSVSAFQAMYRYMIKRAEDYDHHPWSDQPMYNEFIHNTGICKMIDHPNFCTVLYKNFYNGTVKKEGNKFYNLSGDLYSIVHGNGSSKEHL